MVLCLNMKPNDALKCKLFMIVIIKLRFSILLYLVFADGRGHKLERNNYIEAVISYKDNDELKEAIKAPYKKERINRHSRWGNEEQQQQQPEHVETVKAVSSYGEWRAAKAARLSDEAKTVENTRKPHRHHRADYSQDKNITSWRSGSIPQGSLKETSSRDRNNTRIRNGSIPQRSFNEPSHKSYKRDSSRISRSDNHGSQSSRFNAPGRETAISSSTSSETTSTVHNSRFKKVNHQTTL